MTTSNERLTQISAPEGTFATLGHPRNNRYIVKTSTGRWRYAETGMLVDEDDFRAGWDMLFIPTPYPSE